MVFRWPDGFERIPDAEWTRASVDSLAANYDTVEKHGWYANLDPTVETLRAELREGDVLVDYSGGTGILIDRLLEAMPKAQFGIVNVDSSPKFLALCLQKFRDEPRVAFRLIGFLKEEKRLQYLDEALAGPLVERRADALASTNAIHLYYDLDETLRSWARVLRPGARVHVQSGNIRNPDAPEGAWIIDDTIAQLHREAQRIVREQERFSRHRAALENADRMARHDALREKFFLPPRSLETYTRAMDAAGLRVVRLRTVPIQTRVEDWLQFLAVYHEGILGWVGGSRRVEGRDPTPQDVEDRKLLLRLGMQRLFEGRERFEAVWTYLDAVRG